MYEYESGKEGLKWKENIPSFSPEGMTEEGVQAWKKSVVLEKGRLMGRITWNPTGLRLLCYCSKELALLS